MRKISLVLAVVALTGLTPGPAHGCSCVVTAGQFVVPPAHTMPAGARGVVWWGEPITASVDAFRIETLGATGADEADGTDGTVELPVDVQPADASWTEMAPGGERKALFLVRPTGGLQAGTRYRVSWRASSARGEASEADGSQEIEAETVVEVEVDGAPIPWPTETRVASLTLVDQGVSHVTNQTRSGSCSTTIEATTATLEMQLPAALTEHRQHLAYSVFVDGELWLPRSSLCNSRPPIQTSVGPARTRVFALCRQSADAYGPAEDALDPGRHTVRMLAWRPGYGGLYEGSAEVELLCE